MRPFGITVEPANDHVLVAVTGELDLAVAPKLETCLARLDVSPGGRLVVDLSDLDFLDSSGLRVLVMAHQRAEQEGFRLVLVRGPEAVARVFELTRMDEQLSIIPSRDALATSDG
jgi:anti-sigma B factor antagonist